VTNSLDRNNRKSESEDHHGHDHCARDPDSLLLQHPEVSLERLPAEGGVPCPAHQREEEHLHLGAERVLKTGIFDMQIKFEFFTP